MRKTDHLNKAFQRCCLICFVGEKLTSLNPEKSNRSALAKVSSSKGQLPYWPGTRALHEQLTYPVTTFSSDTFHYRKEDYDPSPPPGTPALLSPSLQRLLAPLWPIQMIPTSSRRALVSSCPSSPATPNARFHHTSSVLVTMEGHSKTGGKRRIEINMHRRNCISNTAQTAFYGGPR